ncbi:MAG TPA: hypothetical protein V6D18_09130 [Thermosynechococcaceae cyanobacterium]
MKKVLSTINALKRVLTIGLAAMLLMLSTACNSAQAKDAKDALKGGPNVPGQAQPYEGGMNNFRDVDSSRLDTKGADVKAKALKDTVERNIKTKSIDSVDDYVDNYKSGTPLGERIGNIGKDVGGSAKDLTKDVKAVGEKGSADLKRNADRAPGAFKNAVDNAKDNTKDAVKDNSRSAKRIGDNLGEGAKSIGDKAKRDAARTADTAKDKVNDVVDNTKRAFD